MPRLEEIEHQVRREVAMEHIQRGLPRDLQARIDARGPRDVDGLVQCIQEFQLRNEAGPERTPSTASHPKTVGGRTTSPQKANPKPRLRAVAEKKEVTCYKCGKKGHYARDCMERSFGSKLQLSAHLIRQGAVSGIQTNHIQVDSGSSLTSVHKKFVADVQLTGRQVTLRNTKGPHTYPTAMVTIELDGWSYQREVAVSPQLPEDVLLGTDVPLLRHILKSLTKEEKQEALSALQEELGGGDQELATEPDKPPPSAEEVSYVMTTRAQVRKLQPSEKSIRKGEMNPRGLEPTANKYYTHVSDANACVSGAQSRRPSSGTGSESHITGALGAGTTGPAPTEECKGQGQDGTVGPPTGSIPTRAPETEEEITDIDEEATIQTGEPVIPNEHEAEETTSTDAYGEFKFADDLFPRPSDKRRKTRAERRACQEKTKEDTYSRAELIREQLDDAEIQRWREKEKAAHYTVLVKDGVLCWRWIPKAEAQEAIATQVVLPKQHRTRVLQMAHDLPTAGHLGVERTLHRIRKCFWWPGIICDVKQYCQSCETCQKTVKRNPKAPLVSMPIIRELFQRIAMDFIGPLPRTSSGN